MKTICLAILMLTIAAGRCAAQVYAMTEAFVPSTSVAPSTLELRNEATVIGREVKLKSVCRWNDGDARTFAPVAELVIAKIDPANPFRGISIDQVKDTLTAAGINVGRVRFTGALHCTITRSDAEVSGASGLEKWEDAKQDVSAKPQAAVEAAPTTAPVAEGKTLREILTEDLAQHLGFPVDSIQLQFNPQDEKLVSLTDSAFKFQIIPQRVRNLGTVQWDVNMSGAGGARKAVIGAYARAWQDQIVTTRALAYKQLLTDADVVEKRALVDRLPDDALLTRPQIVGQQAARELHPGTVVTSHSLEAVPLVKAGQLVTITLTRDSMQVTTVARAIEAGTYGQTIRVKSEATKDLFDVTLTGPQTAKMD